MSKSTESVKVVVRCRPLNSKETADGRTRIVDMDQKLGQVQVRNPKGEEPPKVFTFDQVYDWTSSQMDVFAVTARPIIDACIDGYNGTIFAYGQTGTGKSHTMEGKEEPPELRGIIPNSFNYVFDQISQQGGSREFLVRASYLEIYNEEIRDLLSKNPEQRLELKETPDRGVYVKDLLQFVVKSVAEINSVLQVGKKNRMVGSTLMNQDSSRSHSIFTITIETTDRLGPAGDAAAAAAAALAAGKDDSTIRVGKLNLVDLAGSERQSKTGATGDRLKEGIKINLSLTALGNVISALVDGKSGHVPYRDSKLTRLLQDSLGGNTKTVMVANVGPADWNYDETISTLRYANRAKNITNKPRINEDPKDAMLREFQEEIARLKTQLASKQGGRGGGGGGSGSGSVQVVERIVEVEPDQQQLMEQLRAQMRAELATKLQQDGSGGSEVLAAARAEAEANARKKLEEKMAESNASEEERRKLREALKQQMSNMRKLEEEAERDRAEQAELQEKIAAMEGKVLHGGVNLLDKVDELKARSNATKQELEVRARQQAEQHRRLQQLQVQQVDLNAKYNTLEEEIATKTQQLKALWAQYQARKAEGGDVQQQFQAEREDLLEDYRTLTQQIKLKNLIIACFIPPQYQELIMQHCHWNEYEEAWNIEYVEYAGAAVRARREAQQQQQQRQPGGNGASASSSTGSTGFTVAKVDAERLQKVFKTFAQMDEELGLQPSTSSSSSSSSSPNRPGTAGRRVSRDAGSPVHVSRPGSSAARRTRELLGGMLKSDSPSSTRWGDGGTATAAAAAAAAAGGILGGRKVAGATSGALKGSGSAGDASGSADVIPVARGLVKGSTDAMRRVSRSR